MKILPSKSTHTDYYDEQQQQQKKKNQLQFIIVISRTMTIDV